nr:MAG TPA: hypothetical protein [Caudoviricetes sp.]
MTKAVKMSYVVTVEPCSLTSHRKYLKSPGHPQLHKRSL